VINGAHFRHTFRIVSLVVAICMATTGTGASELLLAEPSDGMSIMGLRVASFTLMAALGPTLRSFLPPADSTNADTLRYTSGDPSNRDLPATYPYSTTNRNSYSKKQPRNTWLPLPSGYSTTADLDTTGRGVLLRELISGIDVGEAIPMDLDTYLKYRSESMLTAYRDSAITKYEMKKTASDAELTKLLMQATNITIPLPPNPIFGIFGKPEVSINVNGEVNVRGGWRWDTQRLGTASVYGQTQSSPIFQQNIQVNVSARIGDKFKMNVDWNTLNQFEFNNRFKVGYEGYDDDIIKRVEFGNVNLESQSQLIGGGQTLFGVRADFQFGALFLKTIASQRRGERRFVNARGGSSRTQFNVRAYDYARNHFFLDTAYHGIWKEYFKSATPVLPQNGASLVVKEIEVWESTTDVRDVTANEAIAIDTLSPIKYLQGQRYPASMRQTEIKAGYAERGRFARLPQNRYEIDLNLGTLTILNLRTDRSYAVSYRTEGPTSSPNDDDYHGTLSTTATEKDTMILKLVSRQQMQPGFRNIWARQMRNVYTIGVTNVSPADAKIGMWYFRNTNDSGDVLNGAPDKIVTIFRIDQVNNGTGAQPPDGAFDARPPIFNAVRGEITFPSLEPFRSGLREYFASKGNAQLAEQYVFNEVYDTTDLAARLNSAKDRFVIIGEAAGVAGGSRINLAYNTAPGSVKVTLDGVPLREGSDYTVDYYTGTLNVLNSRALLPNANLQVEYEQNDIFNVSTRTLLGVRADMQLFKTRRVNSSIGMTLMNYNQAAVIDRVAPGQEPNANLMFGIDGKINADLPWLTRALDALPFFDTKDRSSFTAQGEWALVAPTPNKRFSTVCSDNGLPVAYLDDFESARRYISFGLTPAVWNYSSASENTAIWPNDTMAAQYRARLYWYQFFVPDVPQVDVYPNRARVQGRSNITPLHITFDHGVRGIYNTNAQFIDALNPRWNDSDSDAVRATASAYIAENKTRIWGGMMRLLSPFNTNFDNENIDYIEVMMRIDSYDPNSRMFIDLGQISEDIIPNKTLNTEDRSPPNNLIDQGEDRGIDTLFNAEEKDVYPDPLNREADPARDDYKFNFGGNRAEQSEGDFVQYNNFEGNASQSEVGQFPDTEILNKNNGQTIMLDNSYFRYEVRLDPNPANNTQIVGGNPDKGWFLFRIPVRRPDSVVGNPLYTNIQYIRVFFQGGYTKVSIADWGLVGSYWLRNHSLQSGLTPNDSALAVAYVSREENSAAPTFYTMPPCVSPPRQLQNPDPRSEIYFNEQSLVVRVRNLSFGEERMAVRIYRSQDIFYYKQLAFFIHGDQTMPDKVATGAIPPAYAYIRFGIDSVNYYEYRRPLLRGWQDIHIIMGDLTAIKQIRDQGRTLERQEFPVPGDEQAIFAIRGNPILTRIQFVGFGVANPAQRYPNELTTDMWVDEMRLVEPTDNTDWAAVASGSLRLADLAEFQGSIKHSQPNFHRLEDRFGNRMMSTNWNVTMVAGLEKLLPKDLNQTRIPLSITHTEIAETPLYAAQNDVELTRAAEAAKRDTLSKGATEQAAAETYDRVITRSQRVLVQDQIALTGIKLGIPVKSWWIDDTFNKMTFAYSYSQEFERSQVVESRFRWNWQFKADYAVTIPAKYDVSPAKFLEGVPGLKAYKDFKINFLPSNINLGVFLTRSRATEQSRFLDFPSPVVREFVGLTTASFNWKLIENGFLSPIIDYKVMSYSTLVPFELDANGKQRTGSDMASQIFFNDGFINLGTTNRYDQTITITMRPRLPDFWGLNRLIETTASYSSIYNWFDPLQPDPLQRDIVRTAKYNATLRVSPILRWRQLGQEIFGAPRKSPEGFMGELGNALQDIFFGFENLTFVINNNTTSTNGGVLGGASGVTNLWARTLTFRGNDPMWGPSTAYQLGLVDSPHGGISIEPSSSFPFFKFGTSTGLRPSNGVMQDDYSQKTTLQFQTSRPLWPGATLDLTMKSDFGYTKNQRVLTDAAGVPSFANVNKRQTLDRTFLSIPSWFVFGAFNDNVENVIALYNAKKAQILTEPDTSKRNQQLLEALATSFRDGFESLQLFSGELARIAPALNWTFRWDGIEKFPLFKGIAQRIYLEHSYVSTYQENARINDNGRVIEVQQVSTGFQPLVGITMNFDDQKLKGTLTATLRYNTKTAYQLNASARSTISREVQNELQIQASYLKRGMVISFLGLDLQNDVEFTFLTQIRHSTRSRFDVLDYQGEEGSLVDGTTQITIEPRARYIVSNRVTASAFFRYEGNFSSGATSPGFSTSQVGVDIRLSISGGR
jgi:hypothetical protein